MANTSSVRIHCIRGLLAAGAALCLPSFAGNAQETPAAPPPAPAAPAPQAAPAQVPFVPASTPDQEKLRILGAKRYPGTTHMLPATMETTQWGWFNNAQPPVLHVNSGDTIVFETMMHSHNQVVPGATIDQIKKLRTDYPGARAAHVDRPGLHRGCRTGRCPQDPSQQDRAARLRDELQRARHVRRVSGSLPGRTGEVFLSRPRPQGRRVRARHRDSAGAVPRHDRGRARRARPIFIGAAGSLRRQPGHPRYARGHDALRAGVRERARCCGPATPTPPRATARSISPRSRPLTRNSASRSKCSRP